MSCIDLIIIDQPNLFVDFRDSKLGVLGQSDPKIARHFIPKNRNFYANETIMLMRYANEAIKSMVSTISYPVIRTSEDYFHRRLIISQFTNDHLRSCEETTELL